jgi:hypothetical protein
MPITGWNDAPSDAITKFNFHNTSLWLRTLARVPFFERFAYPIAVKRGLGTIWFPEISESRFEEFLKIGWKVKYGHPSDHELFLQGSKALLTQSPRSFRKPRIAITRLGKELAWTKAIHRANGTQNLLRLESSPFDDLKN